MSTPESVRAFTAQLDQVARQYGIPAEQIHKLKEAYANAVLDVSLQSLHNGMAVFRPTGGNADAHKRTGGR